MGTECERMNSICKQTHKITSSAAVLPIKFSQITILTKVQLRNDTYTPIFTPIFTHIYVMGHIYFLKRPVTAQIFSG